VSETPGINAAMSSIVSVIIPCFNTGAFLGDAIKSVLGQTDSLFEIIVVDDGSTDDTKQIVGSFEDSRIRYVYQENRGLSSARNTGLAETKGELVTFLDADDTFLPDKLTAQRGFLDTHPEVGLVAGGYVRTTAEGEAVYSSVPRNRAVSLEALLMGGQFPVHVTLLREAWVERVGGFDESLNAAEDWDFYCRLALTGCPILQTRDIVATYRAAPKSMSSDPSRQTLAMKRVLEKMLASDLFPERLRSREAAAWGSVHLRSAVRFFGCGMAREGASELARMAERDPGLLRDWRRIGGVVAGWSRFYQAGRPTDLLDVMFDNLPDAAKEMRAIARAVRFHVRLKQYQFRRETQGAKGSIRDALRLVMTSPLRTGAHFASQACRRVRDRR